LQAKSLHDLDARRIARRRNNSFRTPENYFSGRHVTEIYVNPKCKQIDLRKCIERTSKSVSLTTTLQSRGPKMLTALMKELDRTARFGGVTLGGLLHPTRKFACSFESTINSRPIVESDLTVANSVKVILKNSWCSIT
jgi:hypothetical protein